MRAVGWADYEPICGDRVWVPELAEHGRVERVTREPFFVGLTVRMDSGMVAPLEPCDVQRP